MSIEVEDIERKTWKFVKSQSFEMPDLKSETKLPRPSLKKLNSDIVEVNGSEKLTSPENAKSLNGIDKETNNKISEATFPEDESDSNSPKSNKEEAKEVEN